MAYDKPSSEVSSARERGMRALDAANNAFSRLHDEQLEHVTERAVHEAREFLAYYPVVTLSNCSVTTVNKTARLDKSAPSLTPTLSLTAS